MTDAPAVSVVMAVLNGAAFLDQAVASIRRQSFADFEFVIVDDGSVDQTGDILARHAAEDARLRILRQAHAGLVPSLNRGIEAAAAPLVARMDADDLAEPQRLARQVALLAAEPQVVVVGSNYVVVDAAGNRRETSRLPTTPEAIRAALPASNPLAHPTVMMRRATVMAAGGYRRAFLQCEDYDLWLRLAERHDLRNIDEPLLLYRQHPGQLEWSDVEQRALSVMGARLAARCRRAGQADPFDGCDRVTRDRLRGLGLEDRAIGEEVAAWAIGAATVALRAGDRPAARRSIEVARRQQGIGMRTRFRAWALTARLSLPAHAQERSA
jgi:glycosyltransferase involved in cell wall biosynthesis